MVQLIIYRQSPPNKYDQLPKNTQCIVTAKDFSKETWQQVSKDPEQPIWVKV